MSFFKHNDEILNQLWVEKYRPREINELVLDGEHSAFVNKCFEKEEIPHLALFGPPGSGKSTLARIFIDLLVKHEMDILMLNGSKDTGIDVVRNDIVEFLKSPPYLSKLKLVYIDESDYLSQNAQASLRNITEEYAEVGRFIITGNYPSKIIEPLWSRFTLLEMDSVPEEYIIEHCKKILQKENIKFENDTVDMIVKNYNPDVRKIINTLQKNIIDNKLKNIDVNSITTSENEIAGLIVEICDSVDKNNLSTIVNKNTTNILKILSDDNKKPDFMKLYQMLFKNDNIPAWAKIKVNEYSNKHNSCILPAQHFMALIYDILQTGMVYNKMFMKK